MTCQRVHNVSSPRFQISHAFFTRFEPRALSFLGLLSGLYFAAAAYTYTNAHEVLYSTVVSAVAINAFVCGLLSSVVLYRLAPWHPLAQYPGPTLGKITKWYMGLCIRKTVGLALATLAPVAMALIISGSGKSSLCNSCSHGMSLNNSNKLIKFEVI